MVCKNLLKEWKCDIVCFQESKLFSLNSFVVRNLWGIQFVDWVVLDAVNIAAGGGGWVLLVWDKRVFEKVDCAVGLFSVGLFSVNVLLKEVVDDFVWDCSGECMGLMMIVSGVLYGRSLQGCIPGGIQHGVCLGISIPFDIRARDLVVRFLVWLCLLS